MWFCKKKEKVKNLIVHYINVLNVLPEDVETFIEKIREKLGAAPEGSMRYFVPTRAKESCIEVHYLQQ